MSKKQNKKSKKLALTISISSENDDFGGLDISIDTNNIHPGDLRAIIYKALDDAGIEVTCNFS
jgi:hypothetical protein